MKSQEKPKILFALPLPPPYSGQEMITQMLLASPLPNLFDIVHIDTSNKTSNVNRGKLDWQNSFATLKNFFKLVWLIWREQPDIANIPMPTNRFGFIKFTCFVLPCAWSGPKVVSRSGGEHFDKFYDNETYWMQAFIRYTLQHIDTVIVRADCLKHSFEPFLPAGKIWTVYLGLDTNMFENVLETNREKRKINVLYVGHISKAKGGLDLLEAIPHIITRYPNTRFQFAGDVLSRERNITFIDNPSDIIKKVDELISRKDVRQAVELLGIIKGSEKLKAFINSDIFALPSYAEGFPFAVLEAMLAGKAVITTPVGALPEVFEHEKHLLFVQPGDIKGIASAVNRLIENPDLRIRLGQSARQIVQTQFNLQILADRMETVFKSVLDGRKM